MYFYIIPAWLASLIAIYFLGYYFRGLVKRVAEIEQAITMKVDKKPVVEEPSSTLLDPNDAVAEAIWEHKQMLKRLNPDD